MRKIFRQPVGGGATASVLITNSENLELKENFKLFQKRHIPFAESTVELTRVLRTLEFKKVRLLRLASN